MVVNFLELGQISRPIKFEIIQTEHTVSPQNFFSNLFHTVFKDNLVFIPIS